MTNYLTKIVKYALTEDIGTGDVSSGLLADKKTVQAVIISNENAIICGIKYAQEVFRQLDDKINIKWLVQDGGKIAKNTKICTIIGNAKNILTAERVVLNFLQTLSATATATNILVGLISHTKAQILDTRKTIPNLRLAQKQAVVCGGGSNHRFGLYDMIMLKENHINAYGGLDAAITYTQKQHPKLPLIVEVETLTQLQIALKYQPTRILCDNFSPKLLSQAVQITAGTTPLEASGNINKTNIVDYAQTGVDYISIGSITKDISAVDLSLRFL